MMMKRTIGRAICLTLLSIASAAAAAEQNWALLIGRWAVSETTAVGDVGTATFELKADATFRGTGELNHEAFWAYSGTWSLEGNKLYWRYTASSIPLPEEDRTDSDEVSSVDDRTLVLISQKDGKRRTFFRRQ